MPQPITSRNNQLRYDDVIARKSTALEFPGIETDDLAPHLFPHQRDLVRWALRRGRAHAAVVRPDYTVLSAGRDVHKVCASLPAAGPTAPR